MSNIKCKNCEHIFHGNFCPHCGQNKAIKRIDFSYFLHDIPHSIFHIDKGFGFTLKELFTRPGKSLKEYLEGKRVRHFRPFAFVVLLSTICTILIKGIEYLLLENTIGIAFKETFFSKYLSVLIFIMIPILALITYLFFYKMKYNYWEHFLINTYLAACLNIFFLLIKVVILIKAYYGSFSNINYTWFMTLFMTLYGFAFAQLMPDKKQKIKNTAKILLLNFILAIVYLTAFSFAGLMTSWWNF